MTFGVSSFFPAEFGLARGVDAQRPTGTWYAPGPYVQSEIHAGRSSRRVRLLRQDPAGSLG